MKQLSEIEPSGIIQASTNFDEGHMEEKGKPDHYIGVATTNDIPEKWDRLEVSPASWVAFIVVGAFPETMQGAKGCGLVGEPDYYERFGFRYQNILVYEGIPKEYFLVQCL